MLNNILNINENNKKIPSKSRNSSYFQSFQSNKKNKFNKFGTMIKDNKSIQKLFSFQGIEMSSSNNKNAKPLAAKRFSTKDNKNKKIKEKKEMFMISNNIKQNTENLKNPELFYTGLFNNIIEKQKKKSFNSPSISRMRKKNKPYNLKKEKK